jgi:hypothetical protein
MNLQFPGGPTLARTRGSECGCDEGEDQRHDVGIRPNRR